MKALVYERCQVRGEDLIFQKVAELLNARLPEAVGVYGCDLPTFIFNEYQAFTYDGDAEKACASVDVWSSIRLVKVYEEQNFGEVHCEIEPCAIANRLVNIYGEYILSQSKYLQGKAWDRKLNEKDLQIITKQVASWAFHQLPAKNYPFWRELNGLVWDHWETY